MFICFLDASKAYDRVRHVPLFNILLQRGVPTFVVRLLAYWYSSQTMCIQWGNTFSECFSVSNGVRQGEVSSPSLFIVYIEVISNKLNNITSVGRVTGKNIVNNLVYADNMCLIAPSAKG